VLQYLLSEAAKQLQDGWAHFSLFEAIFKNLRETQSVPVSIVPDHTFFEGAFQIAEQIAHSHPRPNHLFDDSARVNISSGHTACGARRSSGDVAGNLSGSVL
jgi:hypothetical protein